MTLCLAEQIKVEPIPRVRVRPRSKHNDLLHKDTEDDNSQLLKEIFNTHPLTRDLIEAISDHSPFLLRIMMQDQARLARMMWSDPDAYFQDILARCDQAPAEHTGDDAGLMRALRHLKQETALLIALADLGGVWSVDQVTECLTAFADRTLRSALRHILRDDSIKNKFTSLSVEDPQIGCGLVVLALGKHGAQELNYSSDIDIVVLYDADRASLTEGTEPAPLFVRIVKALVRLLDQRTSDGYVFRVDLRLRPDPASTPIALSVASAFAYYESVGQNWERAALIKARPVAGDVSLGEDFLNDLAPFIWRKYFDFAAIADIHAMKRQIHAVRGHDSIAVSGHDIKLGRGGIREIEFFVQTQQLVFGGRRPKLRGRKTIDMLRALYSDGWISDSARDDLTEAYRFFRSMEHRLQMLHDEQTQRLPTNRDELKQFALFCGYARLDSFSKAVISRARLVERHYARLFEEGADLASGEGNLVFTGTIDDPDTLETLRRMGYRAPEIATETIRGWHFGRRSGVTSPRAREVLTELIPHLLQAFAKTADPDAALMGFDGILGGMPAAVELFAILREHKAILSLFADLLGSAPRLASTVATRPHLLDAIIDPAFGEPAPSLSILIERISQSIGHPEQIEDFLDRLRETGQHEIFLIGVRMLSGVISPALAAEAYSSLAEAIIRVTLRDVEQRFVKDHGTVKGGRYAVIGMGRLGSREMTATSDLDLVALYDFDGTCGESDGPRPLDPVVYYGRLTQRLISALTVPTRRGTLYAVDMRLRPSGNKGPAATQYRGFLDYHRGSEVDTWEHLALVRARPLAGAPDFMAEIDRALRSILAKPRDMAKVRSDTSDMRRLIAQEKGEADPWDLKLARGGLLDIEFIAQSLVLSFASQTPELCCRHTEAILEVAKNFGYLAEDHAHSLRDAHRLMRDVMQWQRTMIGESFSLTEIDKLFLKRLASVAGLPDFKVLDAHLKATQSSVRAVVETVLCR
jgi:[glutamine synthetase] adenylyltransferase / [glutamine synthetase]-adenylyl-L-tyrosine phosphorylase